MFLCVFEMQGAGTHPCGGLGTVLWRWFLPSISLPGLLGGIQVMVLVEPSGQPHFLFRKPTQRLLS